MSVVMAGRAEREKEGNEGKDREGKEREREGHSMNVACLDGKEGA